MPKPLKAWQLPKTLEIIPKDNPIFGAKKSESAQLPEALSRLVNMLMRERILVFSRSSPFYNNRLRKSLLFGVACCVKSDWKISLVELVQFRAILSWTRKWSSEQHFF